LERELDDLLKERNHDVRTFRFLAQSIFTVWKSMDDSNEAPSAAQLASLIRQSIDDVHEAIWNPVRMGDPARHCVCYLARLIASYFCGRNLPLTREDVVLRMYPMVEDSLRNPRDVRVRLEKLADTDVARLVRHLFDMCRSEGIPLRDEMKPHLMMYGNIRQWLTPPTRA
jgi:hypothetical protein